MTALVTFFWLDLEYPLWRATDFWVFVPYWVVVMVFLLNLKSTRRRMVSSSSWVELWVSLMASTVCPYPKIAHCTPQNAALFLSVVIWLMSVGSPSVRNSLHISSVAWCLQPMGAFMVEDAEHFSGCFGHLLPFVTLTTELVFVGFILQRHLRFFFSVVSFRIMA